MPLPTSPIRLFTLQHGFLHITPLIFGKEKNLEITFKSVHTILHDYVTKNRAKIIQVYPELEF